MVLLLAIVAGVLLALVVRGRLGRLGKLPLRWGWLALPMLVVQLPLVFAQPVPPEQGFEPLRLLLPLTLVCLGVFVLANRDLPGMWLVALGLVANASAIFTNGGLMPTNETAMRQAGLRLSIEAAREHPGIRLARSKDVLLPPDETHLWWLSDTLVSPPIPRRKAMSPGDLLVAAGVVVGIVQVSRGRYVAPSPGGLLGSLEEPIPQGITPHLRLGL
jgi:hypothetical protein